MPVFNDKHLSWNWEWAKSMVDTAKTLGFPLMAGSSLPITWRLPAVDVPWGAPVSEAVCVGFGGLDSYDFHGLETIQCMVERRNGGETGVVAVEALRGEPVWKALAAGSWDAGGCDLELFEACLCRSFTLSSGRPGYGNALPERDQLPARVSRPVLYRVEYADGLKTTLLTLTGLVRDFTVALRIKGESEPLSTQMYLPGFAETQTLPDFFNPLAHHIESMFTTGKAPYPVERTLLTTGVLAAAIDSHAHGPEANRYARPPAPVLSSASRIDVLAELTRWFHRIRARTPAPALSPVDRPRKKLAIVTTVWRYLSHAQHMGDRFLVGYPLRGRWHRPAMDVVSLYVDQKPANDQSVERARSFGFKIYPTISETLRCGGEKLAVDGVLLIAEHGNYPRNARVRSSIRAMISSGRSRRSSKQTAGRCQSSMTSTSPTASSRPRRWWTSPGG